VIIVNVNDAVVAACNIGGVLREFVPAGNRGRVVAAGWSGMRVRFRVGSAWSGWREVEVEVYPGEVEPASGMPRYSSRTG
jgi:hypothetical protein